MRQYLYLVCSYLALCERREREDRSSSLAAEHAPACSEPREPPSRREPSRHVIISVTNKQTVNILYLYYIKHVSIISRVPLD